MNLRQMTEYSTRNLAYHGKESLMYSGDASNIRFNGPELIFTDQTDKFGIALRSHVTGHLMVMELERIDKNEDGDITQWIFKLLPDIRSRNPFIEAISLILFND